MRIDVSICLTLVISANTAQAQFSDPLRERLASEVPKKYLEFMEFSKRIKGRSLDRLILADSKEVLREVENEFKFSDNNALFHSEVKSIGSLKGFNVAVKPTVLAKNSRYSFYLQRPQSGADWILKEWGTNDKLDKNSHMRKFEDSARGNSAPHFRIQRIPLPEFLADPTFVLKEAKYVDGGNSGLVRISFDHREVVSKKMQILDGWMVLDSDHHWCVVEYVINTSAPGYKGQEKAKTRYEIDKSGFPLPTQHSESQSSSSKDDPNIESISELKLEPHDGLSEAEFTLTAFGMPEPMGMPVIEPTGLRWQTWMMLAALVCVVVVIISVRAKRHYS